MVNAGSAVDVAAMASLVCSGDRVAIGRAITLVESTKPEHRMRAAELLQRLAPHAGRALRVGITGVPGVGKSTFVEALGTMLLGHGHRVAVLAVDPSSTRTGGSILGDRTRMLRLAQSDQAFIRPSPTAGTLGGVARATREAMLVLEAAGYDVVLVETVGVGQSEVTVAGMVDCFVFLTLARTGDQLQGIKKGVLELADVIAVNKAEPPHTAAAEAAARELQGALSLVTPHDAPWQPVVQTCSGMDGSGVAEVWASVRRHETCMRAQGLFESRRREQSLAWMWAMVHDAVSARLHAHPAVRALLSTLETEVAEGRRSASDGAAAVLEAFSGGVS